MLIPKALAEEIGEFHRQVNALFNRVLGCQWKDLGVGWRPRHGVLVEREELQKAGIDVKRIPPHIKGVRLVEARYA